jgi:hypothetical protein
MSSEIDRPRQYTDREVRLILKSAVELMQHSDHAGERAGGMSLAELEQVALEAGIDPALVRRAAAQLDAPSAATDRNAFLGSPTKIVIERVVNVVIDPTRFDQMLDVTRAVTREVGEVSSVGRQFGWKGRLDGAKSEVSVSAGERSTTVRVRVDLDEAALGHFMLKGVLYGVGGGLIGSAIATTALGPLGFLVWAGTAGTGYLWARRGLTRDASRHRARAGELLDALAARATEVSAETRPV